LSEVERHQHFIILDEAGALPDPTRILRELLRKPSLGVLAVSSSSRLPKGEFADAIRSKTVSFDWPLPLWSECLDCGSPIRAPTPPRCDPRPVKNSLTLAATLSLMHWPS
jgi:hypothetical protein